MDDSKDISAFYFCPRQGGERGKGYIASTSETTSLLVDLFRYGRTMISNDQMYFGIVNVKQASRREGSTNFVSHRTTSFTFSEKRPQLNVIIGAYDSSRCIDSVPVKPLNQNKEVNLEREATKKPLARKN